MFTGLITAIGNIVSFSANNGGGRLTVQTPAEWLQHAAIGDSIAVDGVCLTAVAITPADNIFIADVSPETLACCAPWQTQKAVNLEHALRVGDKLGGHFVGGHIEGVARLTHIEKNIDNGQKMIFTPPPESSPFIVAKGAVALAGVSLTLNAVTDTDFAVQIIAHTLENTTLAGLSVGDLVNMESDMLARYAAKSAAVF